MPTLPVRMKEDNVKCLGSWLALRELSTSMESEPSSFQHGLGNQRYPQTVHISA